MRAVNIAFRVDASPRIGIGHLMRCLTLADELSERGAHIRFLCGPLSDDYARLVATRGHELVAIPPSSSMTEHVDAERSAAALAGRRWDWVVVDHYALGASWEKMMRAHAARVFAIDDLANRDHDCDLLLDQNYLPDRAARYRSRVPTSCDVLVGPHFALLRPEYRLHREKLKSRDGKLERLLVFFGGTDPHGITELALEALSSTGVCDLFVDIVCPGAASRLKLLEEKAAQRPGTVIHGPRPHLADLMAQADLSLGGGGTTTWERMCLGLPSLVITMAENQREVVDWLDIRGLVRLVGKSETVTAEQIHEAVLDEIRRDRALPIIDEIMRLCDGWGAKRTVDAMLNVGTAGLTAKGRNKEMQ